MLEVIRSAAPIDAEIGALWSRIEQDFLANQRAVAKSLDDKRALRLGLDFDAATDILWTLNLSNAWQLLVTKRGWTPDRFER